MPIASRRRLLVSLLVVVFLSACATPRPDAQQVGAPSPPSPAARPVSSSPSSTPASPRTPPPVPSAAQEHTPEGAAAMVAHQGRLMSFAAESGDARPLVALATTDCTACRAVERDASRGFHTADLTVVAVELGVTEPSQDVVVYATHDATLKISSGGRTRTDEVTAPAPWRLRLVWTDGGWRVTDIGRVDDVPATSNG